MHLEFGVLGPLRVRAGGDLVVAGERQRVVLALLLVRADQVVTFAEFAEAIWDDDPPETARRQVQNAVSQLRAMLKQHGVSAMLSAVPGGYRLCPGSDRLDLMRFESLVSAAQERMAAHRPDEAAALLRDALSLWRGPALTGLDSALLHRHAVRLEEMRLAAVEDCVEQELAAGQQVGLLRQLPLLVAQHPFRERLAGVLMLALCRDGRRADALELYRQVAARLSDELGIGPGPALRRVLTQVLRADPVLDAVAPPDPPPARPVPPTRAAAALGMLAPPLRRRREWVGAAIVRAQVVALVLLLGGDLGAPAYEPMTGLFNIVVAPIAVDAPSAAVALTGRRLDAALRQYLRGLADSGPTVRVRTVPGTRAVVDRPTSHSVAVARRYAADVVISGSVQVDGDVAAVRLHVYVSDRTLAETPELVGLHTTRTVEPVEAVTGNWQLNEDLVAAHVHRLTGLVALSRGLGAYSLEDFPAAEAQLRTAEEAFIAADRATGTRTAGREALYLMLGNVVGRADRTRLATAEEYFRRALAERPDYARGRLGLAEAIRAGVPCRPGGDGQERLSEAARAYEAALDADGGSDGEALTRMKLHLGLGLAHQCASIVGGTPQWASAHEEFARAIRLLPVVRGSPAGMRHALRLAAEAWAGQALIALQTADQPGHTGFGGYPAAATGYREAIALLDRMHVDRPSVLERKRIFLCNLRDAYARLGDVAGRDTVDGHLTAMSCGAPAVATTPSCCGSTR
ncbi:hypothetical protein Val02_03130 [Virgisporangium aliadipatigenens]|uniref:OmpR/PhoB-type domain-containing protein n=1 Tax=Virgisporangium aliadipatigenens TaxID=741659 RepID=A0A8J3YFE5_9ACTN|nr:AfsR/SARP family transcriptional regulator [Virgisporangium aliadipatigenens]GIJ43427.1 hypothetical protein Val02_03130 [Virgisporangium aliadipatigenens]